MSCHYKDTFEDAREAENNTLDISTNDEEKLVQVTRKISNEIPHKREIQKPFRYRTSLSSSEGEEGSQSKMKSIEKICSQHSMNIEKLMDETAESSCMLH